MQDLFENIDKNLLKKFKKYHLDNQSVFEMFINYAHKMKAIHKKYSAWTIINVIRWETDLKGGPVFKINNDFIALYARLLIYYDSDFEGFFELRSMKAYNRRDSSEERYRRIDG